MTIGTNMHFKLKFQALASSLGKEEVQGDPKGIPDNKEPATDFGALLKAVTTKKKTDTRPAVSDEKMAEPEERQGLDSDNSMPVEQGLFMQPIIALEQMLDRRQHDEQVFPAAKIGELTTEITSVIASDVAVPAPVDEMRQEKVAIATQPQEKKLEPVKVEEPPIRRSSSPASPAPVQAISERLAQPGEAAVEQEASAPASVVEVKSEKPDSKPLTKVSLQEVTTIADKSTPLPTIVSLPQTTLKPSIANIAFVATSASRPEVTDIVVVSDRSVGAARTLVIQLQPVELGTVTARLRLTADGMHIQIDAATTAMADHLSNDREVLSKALHRAGVTDDTSTVTISIVDRSAAGSGATQTGQHNPGGQDQQMGARGNNQGQSSFQNTPRDGSAEQHFFGEATLDDQVDKVPKTDVQTNSSRGLIV